MAVLARLEARFPMMAGAGYQTRFLRWRGRNLKEFAPEGDRRRTSTASLRHRERDLRARQWPALHEARANLSDHLRHRLPLFRFLAKVADLQKEARIVGRRISMPLAHENATRLIPRLKIDLKLQMFI